MIIRTTGTEWTEEDVKARLLYGHACGCGECPMQAIFYLNPNDAVWNPADPEKPVRGPGRVEMVYLPAEHKGATLKTALAVST